MAGVVIAVASRLLSGCEAMSDLFDHGVGVSVASMSYQGVLQSEINTADRFLCIHVPQLVVCLPLTPSNADGLICIARACQPCTYLSQACQEAFAGK